MNEIKTMSYDFIKETSDLDRRLREGEMTSADYWTKYYAAYALRDLYQMSRQEYAKTRTSMDSLPFTRLEENEAIILAEYRERHEVIVRAIDVINGYVDAVHAETITYTDVRKYSGIEVLAAKTAIVDLYKKQATERKTLESLRKAKDRNKGVVKATLDSAQNEIDELSEKLDLGKISLDDYRKQGLYALVSAM